VICDLEVLGFSGLTYHSGKMFLMKTIIHYLKVNEILVITVASLGVAVLMLYQGMIAHYQFKIPLDMYLTTQCVWKSNSASTQLL
jgi:hypothetical protein